jgi:hypothetical protein
MRHLIIGLSLFCAAAAPNPRDFSVSQIGSGVAVSEATSGSELPFKGNLQATETVDGDVHHLDGSGNGTHLGGFTFTADITVNELTGEGVGTVVWTAANGDQIFASTTGEVVNEGFPIITITETQIITGGTGRFIDASGTIILDRSLNLLTGNTTGSYTGTINLGH